MKLLCILYSTFFRTCSISATPTSTTPLIRYDGQIAFRYDYDYTNIWDDIARCIENVTTDKAIVDNTSIMVDRAGTIVDRGYTIWLDSGGNTYSDIDDIIVSNITDCMRRNCNITNISISCHNPFALSANTDEEYEDHFAYYGRGYPIDYDRDYESIGEPTDSGTDQSTLVRRGNGNWPDKILPDQQLHWDYNVIGRLYMLEQVGSSLFT